MCTFDCHMLLLLSGSGQTPTLEVLPCAQQVSCDGTLEYVEVLLRAQQVSCEGTLEYLKVPKMSFGKESTRTNQPNFPPQCFLTKSLLTARKSRQRETKMMS